MPSPIRRIALALVATLLVAGAAPIAAAGQSQESSAAPNQTVAAATRALNTFSDIPVRGTLTRGRVLRGSLDIVNFRARNNGELLAIGRLTGRILNADGDVLRRFSDVRVRLPLEIRQPALAPQGAACDILTLVLGPLHLDLLGLVVDLNQINLRITADPGPGNLLGNLLCAVAGLLDSTGLQGVIAQLLSVIRFIVENL
jgi:hypothetical protein